MSQSDQNQNVELVKKLQQTQNTIISNYGNSVESQFLIAEQLSNAKSAVDTSGGKMDKESYSMMFDNLPFNEKTGEKFIKIHKTDWLRHLAIDPTTRGNLPDGYNTLFSLTNKKFDEPKARAKMEEIFTKGSFTIGDETYKSVEVSTSKVDQILGTEKKKDTSISLFSISVDEETVKSSGDLIDRAMKRELVSTIKKVIETFQSTIKVENPYLKIKVSEGNIEIAGSNGKSTAVSKLDKLSGFVDDKLLEEYTKELLANQPKKEYPVVTELNPSSPKTKILETIK